MSTKATTAPLTTTTTEAVASSTSAVVASWVAVALATVLVALAVMKFKRTKGRLWKFHAAYAAVVALLVFLLPHQIKEDIFSVPGVVVAGMIFPVYQSLRALVTPSTVDDMEWLQYWVAASGIYVCYIAGIYYWGTLVLVGSLFIQLDKKCCILTPVHAFFCIAVFLGFNGIFGRLPFGKRLSHTGMVSGEIL